MAISTAKAGTDTGHVGVAKRRDPIGVNVRIPRARVLPSDDCAASAIGHRLGSLLDASGCTQGQAVGGPEGQARRSNPLRVDVEVKISCPIILPCDEGAMESIWRDARQLLIVRCRANGYPVRGPLNAAAAIHSLRIDVPVGSAMILPADDRSTGVIRDAVRGVLDAWGCADRNAVGRPEGGPGRVDSLGIEVGIGGGVTVVCPYEDGTS